MENKLAIITCVYNNYQILVDFFFSLKNQTNPFSEIFLVDVSDTKQSLPKVKGLHLFNAQNKGYAHAINLGLLNAKSASFQYFAVVNSDVIFSPNFVAQALLRLKKNNNCLIGGKIYYAKGFEYHQKYNQNDLGKILWYAGGKLDWGNCLTKHLGVDEVDSEQYNQFSKTEFVTGCLMLFDDEVLKNVGFWDESYFLYYEDADFCERAKRKGVTLYYDPEIILWHKNAQSTSGAGSDLHQQYQERNRLHFGLKYAPLRTKLHLLKNYLLLPKKNR